MASENKQNYLWWQTGVIYQIYPRSFMDSNGDGVGDLPGITQRLDYLSNTLGVDAIWLSPIYPSPMHDFGYDVADYCDIHPMFGTLADFDRLLDETHRRGLKMVPRQPGQPPEPQTRLVHLARSRTGWRSAE